MNTPIDVAHDYTHTQEFERTIGPANLRSIVRVSLDIAQGAQNMFSAGGEEILPFDARRIRERIRELESYLPSEEV